MIAWLQPAALWGLVLVAAPILIHLLRTRHAPRVPFPSIRFVQPAPVASVRIGHPSDVMLLAVRSGIVGLAVLAVAQPLILSTGRLDAWNGRIARAVLIDDSESMQQIGSGGRPAAARAADAAASELVGAVAAVRIETADLREGLRRALAWLRSVPPARREIVVLSDFQWGTLTAHDLSVLSPGIGLRLVRVGEPRAPRQLDQQTLFAVGGVGARVAQAQLSPEGTRVTILDTEPTGQPGLRVVDPAGNLETHAMLRAVARAGAPAPSEDQPIALYFVPGASVKGATALRERWMVHTVFRLTRDPELMRLTRIVEAGAAPLSDEWTVVLQDGRGRPFIRAAALERELLLNVAAPASSYFAAAAVRAALTARIGGFDRPEHEVITLPPATLSAWNRAPAPVGRDGWQHAESSDARWCWALVLALMGVEQGLRNRKPVRVEEERAAA